MTRKPAQVLVIAAMLASPAGSDGQIVSKPTPPPTIVADNEDWYRSGAFAALQRPAGLNAIFLTYEGARWRPAGPAVEFNKTLFRAAGDYHGFPVFGDDPSSPRAGAR